MLKSGQLTWKQIDMLRSADIEAIEKEELADVSGIQLDNSLTKDQRLERILELTKNPYCFRYGDLGVKIEFSEDGPSLQDLITDFLVRQKSGL